MWTGKWRPPVREELDGAPWIPGSAWPLRFEELQPHITKVATGMKIEELLRLSNKGKNRIVKRLRKFKLEPYFFAWGEKTYRVPEEVRPHQNIRVILQATATNIRLNKSHELVEGITCRSLDGHEITVCGGSYVLATGGLENARILLASNSQIPAGVGNQNDLVGRFYQDHLKLANGRLKPGSGMQELAEELRRFPRPKRSLSLALDASTREEQQLLRHSFFFKPQYDEVGSRSWFSKHIHDGNGILSHYQVKFATEQAPNPDSRLTLSCHTDALGIPVLNVNWRFSNLDHHSARMSCCLMNDCLRRARLGTIEWPEGPPTVESMTDAAHPCSTTRMASSPEEGVVDPDCRVFGHENLFVLGSSVFPAAPVYSPTFTILVLASRLAGKLGKADDPLRTPDLD